MVFLDIVLKEAQLRLPHAEFNFMHIYISISNLFLSLMCYSLVCYKDDRRRVAIDRGVSNLRLD